MGEWKTLGSMRLYVNDAQEELAVREAQNRKEQEAHERYIDRENKRLLGQFPRLYAWVSFNPEFIPERARMALNKNEQAFNESMQIIDKTRVIWVGPPGSGKTVMAIAAAKAWYFEHRNQPTFIDAYRLGTARIQHSAGEGEPQVVRDALHDKLVIIDDLGAEKDTANNAVPDILFHRHAEERATWITTGQTKEQLASRYGGGIARRLFEDSTVIRLM